MMQHGMSYTKTKLESAKPDTIVLGRTMNINNNSNTMQNLLLTYLNMVCPQGFHEKCQKRPISSVWSPLEMTYILDS